MKRLESQSDVTERMQRVRSLEKDLIAATHGPSIKISLDDIKRDELLAALRKARSR